MYVKAHYPEAPFNRLTFYLDSQSKSVIMNIAPAVESRVTDDWFAEDAEGRRYG
jgi:hypothetical protein